MMKRPRSFDDDEDCDDDDRDRHRRHRHLDRRDSSRSFDHHRRVTMRRSESFSASSFRRDFPKGFRSDRREHHSHRHHHHHHHRGDRHDRRFSSPSPSPSSSSSPLLRRFGGNDSGGRLRDGRDRDLRSSRDSSSGEPPKTEEEEEAVIGDSRSRRSRSSSEMEEGELQPEPENEEVLSYVVPYNGKEKEEEEEEGRRNVGTNGNDNNNYNNNGEDEESGNKEETTLEVKNLLVEEEKCVGGEGGDELVTEDTKTSSKTNKEEDNVVEAEPEGEAEKEASKNNHRDEDEPTTNSKLVVSDEPRPQENHKDKGKSISPPRNEEGLVVDEVAREEGPSSRRGFDLFFASDDAKENSSGTSSGRHKDNNLILEALDLSLGLPGIPPDHVPKLPVTRPGSPSRVKSVHSMPSSFRTGSDGFTASILFSGSQTFLHNPSCSLTQNSVDYEQSVGSHPLFQGVDQVSSSTIWQAQASNEPKWKGGVGGAGLLLQRVLMNGNTQHVKPDDLTRQCSLPRLPSPALSHGSPGDTRSEHSKDKRLMTRERSSSSLFRSEQKEGEQLVLNAVGFDRILSKIVSEPTQAVGRLIQEMTDHSVSYLKEAICEMVISADKRGNLHALQEALKRRLDLTIETMTKCPRTLLEILVALKTGLPDFLRRSSNNVPPSDLAEIFHNLKCCNLACRNILPVDDCECKVCTQRSGFCSACMCLVCSKFDNASNTCGWVGCDLCIHWCHTDCGLLGSHIRNGPCSGTQGRTEMQFHCVACNHPSEMFGFVKDVFMTCVKDWKAETLVKELQYVRRIFAASKDLKGQRLYAMANQMLLKLEVKTNLSEVVNVISGFFSESEANISNNPSITAPKEPSGNITEGSHGATSPIKALTWLPSLSSDRVSHRENTGTLSLLDYSQLGRQTKDAEMQIRPEKKPDDELESVVRFKQAEAKMYQERADGARREAEGLKRIAVAKNVQVEEYYATRIAKLQLSEAEERRRKKFEELQVIERAHRQYFNMKMRMESEISGLLSKMEATKRNFST